MMWNIINEIRRRGTMNGNDVSDYSIHALGRKKKNCGRLYSTGNTVWVYSDCKYNLHQWKKK